MNSSMSLRTKISLVVMIIGGLIFLIGIASLVAGKPGSRYKLESYEQSAQSADVKSAEINIGYGKVNISTGTQFEIKCKNVDTEKFECKITNNVLKINYDTDLIESMYMGKGDGIDTTFDITLPKKLLEEVSYTQNCGKVSIKGVTCNTFSLSSSRGDILLNGVSVNHSTKFDLGSGKCEINSCTLQSPEIKGGLGNSSIVKSRIADMTYNGSFGDMDISGCVLSGSTNLDCGMSDTNVSLTGGESGYGFSFDKGFGDITVFGQKYKKYEGTTGSSFIIVSNSFGDVIISSN